MLGETAWLGEDKKKKKIASLSTFSRAITPTGIERDKWPFKSRIGRVGSVVFVCLLPLGFAKRPASELS